MSEYIREVTLYGRIFIRGYIQAETGLHIGGAQTGLEIGGVDNLVIRNPWDNRPYIPGSSIRGKMRSLWEKRNGASQNQKIGENVYVHICQRKKDERNNPIESVEELTERYNNCPVCPIYGVLPDEGIPAPTRLIVRDVLMWEESAKHLLEKAKTDLLYTEVKWEAAIDRVTSAATPRQMERVPAGTIFSDLEMVFSVYDPGDLARFPNVLESMLLLEDDYLGGLGSRGSGQISFRNITISLRSHRNYAKLEDCRQPEQEMRPGDWLEPSQYEVLTEWLAQNLPVG